MQLQHPFAITTPTVDGDVLRVLAAAHGAFTVPQLHHLIPGRSSRGIRNSLDRLARQGIVVRNEIGASHSYALNDEHLAAGAVREIADLKSALIVRLGEYTRKWAITPVFGAVFGSAARGDMHDDSDLDLFLVRPAASAVDTWDADVARLTEAATRWTGNDTRVVEVASDEIDDASLRPLLQEIVADGVAFVGDPDWLRKLSRGRMTA